MAVPEAPQTETLRESWQGPTLDAVLLTAFMVLLVSRTDGGVEKAIIGLWVLLLLGELYRMWRPVAVLTPTEFQVIGLHPRKVPWAEIREITTEKQLGAWRIVLVLADASRVALDAPRASFVAPRAKLDNAVAKIRRHWLAHRGPNWSPPAASDSPRPAEGQAG